MAVAKWQALEPDELRKVESQDKILVVLANGRGYYGKIFTMDRNEVVLMNGESYQRIPFYIKRGVFQVIEGPEPFLPKMGESKLI